MFTGIVDHLGFIERVQLEGQGPSFGAVADIKSRFSDLRLGESVAVQGVCLTVVSFDSNSGSFRVHLSPETLRCTSFAKAEAYKAVNLERALALGDRLGGHFVTGHVDQQAQVKSLKKLDEYLELEISASFHSPYCLFKKGSIAVNGVSLTIHSVQLAENKEEASSFKVMLIPQTLAMTDLQYVQQGDWVNLEFDLLTKIINERVGYLASSLLELRSHS